MLSEPMDWTGNSPIKIPACSVQLRMISQPAENPNGYGKSMGPWLGHD